MFINKKFKSQNQNQNDRSIDSFQSTTVYGKSRISLEIENLTTQIEKLGIETKNLIVDNVFENCTRNFNQNKMCNENNPTNLYNSLRIPDAIKDLPKYDGNRHTLFDFIENIEEILNLCNEIDGEPCSKIFLRAIRNKIVGEVNEVLNMYGTPLEWEAIKDNLTTHYSDKRNETSLIKDLHQLYQGNNTVENFFSKIIDIQSTIINHVKLNETNNIIISSKRTLYEEMCLNTFLCGLKEPLGSMIRATRPDNLAEAFNYCLEEQNMFYLRNKTQNQNSPQPHLKKQLFPQRTVSQNQYYNRNPINVFQPRIPPPLNKPINQFHYSNNNPNFFQKPNFYQPNKFNQYQQPNRNSQNQVFKSQQNYKKPEPMDTTSNINKYTQPTRFSNQPNYNTPVNFNQFRQTGPPRFQSQELFTVENPQNSDFYNSNLQEEYPEEINPNYYKELDNYSPNNHHEIDDEDFQQNASEHPLDI